jgi:hypothetical protein
MNCYVGAPAAASFADDGEDEDALATERTWLFPQGGWPP